VVPVDPYVYYIIAERSGALDASAPTYITVLSGIDPV
jgi:hypothetical protein